VAAVPKNLPLGPRKVEQQKWVDSTNSSLLKVDIRYWRNCIGINGLAWIGIGGGFQSEWSAGLWWNMQILGHRKLADCLPILRTDCKWPRGMTGQFT